MRRVLCALSLSLFFAPALAHATPSVKGQIAKDVHKLDSSLKFRASAIQTLYLNGAAGEFSLQAARPAPHGLAPTIMNVSGSFNALHGQATISNVIIKPAPIQPR
jgi:hypothetical protein